ncbi:Aste57867_21342 [Aphanomyces stellatus]|uniref:Aste57867_21342 protein n=1 Tax=Aphanomyces stellatus TaxID=120398 RepID=A0A485LJC6_9STRA|nr:hypothetical protein As57867_021273 [Aphanomyces stellatus]VFT98014.1 Aste57867_21342 [Aphanomyces stellatus]
MFTKIVLVATCAAAAVAAGDKTIYRRSVTTSYGAELLGELLSDLNVTHDNSTQLTDEEYNIAVDEFKGLLTGEYNVTNTTAFQADVKTFFSLLSPDEYEQLTDDVVTELVNEFFDQVFFGDDDEATTPAPTEKTAAPMKKSYRVRSGATRV